MGDRRQQKDGRSNWSTDAQNLGEILFGVWKFWKQDLTTGRIVEIKLSRAGLEINTAIFMEKIMCNVRQSQARFNYFTERNEKDVDWFNAVDELKKGARVYTTKAVYWATHTYPAKAEATLQAAA